MTFDERMKRIEKYGKKKANEIIKKAAEAKNVEDYDKIHYQYKAI